MVGKEERQVSYTMTCNLILFEDQEEKYHEVLKTTDEQCIQDQYLYKANSFRG